MSVAGTSAISYDYWCMVIQDRRSRRLEEPHRLMKRGPSTENVCESVPTGSGLGCTPRRVGFRRSFHHSKPGGRALPRPAWLSLSLAGWFLLRVAELTRWSFQLA